MKYFDCLTKGVETKKWWAVKDLNLRQMDQKSTALPTELTAHIKLYGFGFNF